MLPQLPEFLSDYEPTTLPEFTNPLTAHITFPDHSNSLDINDKARKIKTSNSSNSLSTLASFPSKDSQLNDEFFLDFEGALEYEPLPDLLHFESVREEQPSSMLQQSKKINKEEKIYKYSVTDHDKRSLRSQRRDNWKPGQDSKLLALYAKYGPKWTQIASQIGKKNGKQVRDRYLNMLRPDINHGDWTPEEDALFASLCKKYGNQWCKIASHLPGRTENQVKNKFHWEKRKKRPVKKSAQDVPEESSSAIFSPEESAENSLYLEQSTAITIASYLTTTTADLPEAHFKITGNLASEDVNLFLDCTAIQYRSQILEENFREVNLGTLFN